MADNYDEDEGLFSETVWSFADFKNQVLNAYPNGRAIQETLVTVGGENTWKIEFYPNGKDSLNRGKISVVITLVKTNDKNLLSQIEAECNYRIINKDKNKNFVGKINRQKFKSYVSAHDSSFDTSILDDCEKDCFIGICIAQYQPQLPAKAINPTVRGGVILNNNNNNDNTTQNGDANLLKEDFKRITVTHLY